MNNDKSIFEQKIEAVLDLPIATQPIIKRLDNVVINTDGIDGDFNIARENLHQIIHKGHDALEEAIVLAKSSEHPRAFEVVGQLIKTLVDANKDLLDIQKKLKDLKKDDSVSAKNVTNALFVGSTSELQKLINSR